MINDSSLILIWNIKFCKIFLANTWKNEEHLRNFFGKYVKKWKFFWQIREKMKIFGKYVKKFALILKHNFNYYYIIMRSRTTHPYGVNKNKNYRSKAIAFAIYFCVFHLLFTRWHPLRSQHIHIIHSPNIYMCDRQNTTWSWLVFKIFRNQLIYLT